MANGTEDAAAFIADTQAELALDDSSSIVSIVPEAVQQAIAYLGPISVQYVGKDKQFRPNGAGPAAETYDYAARPAKHHPSSQGPGVLLQMPGRGAEDAAGSKVMLLRIAKSEIDKPGEYRAARATATVWSFGASGESIVDSLKINVPVEAGTTSMLTLTGFIEVKSVSSAVGIDAIACIGDESVRVDPLLIGYDNLTGSDAESLQTGYTDQWHGIHLEHSRLIVGTDLTTSAGVSCFIKVKQIGSASGGGTTNYFKPGDLFTVTADGVNIRATPSTSGTILITKDTGAQGVVNSGPTRANGYTWWNVTIGATTGFLAESYMRRNKGQDTPVATTNSVRSGWLKIVRSPI